MKNYGLDCVNYLTLPSFAFDAFLKMTRAEIELFTDIDMINLINSEYTGHYVAAGSLNSRGDCTGASYSFNGYECDDAVAEVHLKIRISSGTGQYVKDTGKISLESGYEAQYSSGFIMDVTNGVTYWNQDIKGECDNSETSFNVLFTGLANLTVGTNSSLNMITVESSNTAFSLEVKRSHFVCGHDLKATEHS